MTECETNDWCRDSNSWFGEFDVHSCSITRPSDLRSRFQCAGRDVATGIRTVPLAHLLGSLWRCGVRIEFSQVGRRLIVSQTIWLVHAVLPISLPNHSRDGRGANRHTQNDSQTMRGSKSCELRRSSAVLTRSFLASDRVVRSLIRPQLIVRWRRATRGLERLQRAERTHPLPRRALRDRSLPGDASTMLNTSLPGAGRLCASCQSPLQEEASRDTRRHAVACSTKLVCRSMRPDELPPAWIDAAGREERLAAARQQLIDQLNAVRPGGRNASVSDHTSQLREVLRTWFRSENHERDNRERGRTAGTVTCDAFQPRWRRLMPLVLGSRRGECNRTHSMPAVDHSRAQSAANANHAFAAT